MDDNGVTNIGIRQIVRLKEIIQRWHEHVTKVDADDHDTNTNTPPIENPPNGGINPAISMRLKGYNVYSDSDVEDGCQSPDLPNDVPKGYLAVYVGPELRRFIIPTSYLSDPLFKVLLEKVEEEFGFDHSGGLTIPCEIETFKYLLNCMQHHQKL
ncbi:auxin-induced protein 6B-like [Rutidosis leptorrhynchoides]|uniref:auxin-induced protein 6B-like n=1 Tax=Rutidosis leptorrhynchoides TaxID=125765 RepID=UPI003A9A1371